MAELLRLLTLRLRAAGERTAVSALLYGGVALLLVFAAAALIYAAAIALSAEYGPVVAALVLAAGAILLALVFMLIIALRRRRVRRLARLRRATAPPDPMTMAASVLPSLIQRNPVGSLVAVAVAAYLLQRTNQSRPRHRKP